MCGMCSTSFGEAVSRRTTLEVPQMTTKQTICTHSLPSSGIAVLLFALFLPLLAPLPFFARFVGGLSKSSKSLNCNTEVHRESSQSSSYMQRTIGCELRSPGHSRLHRTHPGFGWPTSACSVRKVSSSRHMQAAKAASTYTTNSTSLQSSACPLFCRYRIGTRRPEIKVQLECHMDICKAGGKGLFRSETDEFSD